MNSKAMQVKVQREKESSNGTMKENRNKCAEWFHSQNGHTLPSGLESGNAGSLGIPPTISGSRNKIFNNSRND